MTSSTATRLHDDQMTPVSGDQANLPLYDLLQRRATRWPEADAFGGQDGLSWRTISSREAVRLVDILAADLACQGVGRGDRVVLWMPTHWRTPIYLFALWRLGAVAVPFDREMNPQTAAAILTSVAPRCVIAGYGERLAWAQGASVPEWWEPGQAAPETPDSSTSSRLIVSSKSAATR